MLTKATGLAAMIGIIAIAGSASAQDAGDAEAGEKVFRKCKACHVVEEEKNRVGPHLNGVMDRDVASVADYSYSDAMTAWAEDKIWDTATLTTFLEDPRGVVDGTKMAFAGLKKPEDIANVIAYLASVRE